MPWYPISHTLPQYVDGSGDPYSGAVLKAYSNGTSSNINLATDATGGTTASSISLNANGYPEVSGNEVIPHVDESYKLSLYPTQAAADADSGAIWTIDELTAGPTYDTGYYADTGVADAYVITPSPPIAAYAAGQRFSVKALAANTGASTLNVNALGAVSIVKGVSVALSANDILADEIIEVTYDGTNFQLATKRDSFDLNGTKLILDADGDTSITADTDDQIDVEVGGADVVTVTAAGIDATIPFITSGVQVGAAPTGGDKGAGTVNVDTDYYWQGFRVGGPMLLSTVTVSGAVASVTFVDPLWFSADFSKLVVEFDAVYPVTSAANLWMRLSEDAGSTFQAGATDYRHVDQGVDGAGTAFANVWNNDRFGICGDQVNTAASGGASGYVHVIGWRSSAPTMLLAEATWARVTANISGNIVRGFIDRTNAVDGLQFLYSTGNIGGGCFRLYGWLA